MSDLAVLMLSQVKVNLLVLKLQASAVSSPGSSSLGSQVHAAAVNGDRSTLLKLITGNSACNSFSTRRPAQHTALKVFISGSMRPDRKPPPNPFSPLLIWSNWIWAPSPQGHPSPTTHPRVCIECP